MALRPIEIVREHRAARLVGPDGETLEIPASAFHALQDRRPTPLRPAYLVAGP